MELKNYNNPTIKLSGKPCKQNASSRRQNFGIRKQCRGIVTYKQRLGNKLTTKEIPKNHGTP